MFIISNLHRATWNDGFGYRDGYITADVELVDGTHISFSRRDDEGDAVQWLADSLIRPDGFPDFIHGDGSRDCVKRAAADEIAAALTEAAAAAGLLQAPACVHA